MKNQVFQKISLFYESDKLIWIIISLGAILRLIQYLSNRSLWFDESMLALNIIDRSFLELLQPLNYNQGAPIGFLFIEKIISNLLNNSEFALRLFPFLTGIISLYLFYKVANQFIKPKAVPIALSLFAFSKPLIYYSTEMKQYSSDVFAALLLFYLAAKIIQSNQLSVSFAILFGVIGSIIIWLSHPSIFIVAGVGVSLALFFLINKEWIKIARLTIAYFFWVINFIAIYFLFLRNLFNNDLFSFSS